MSRIKLLAATMLVLLSGYAPLPARGAGPVLPESRFPALAWRLAGPFRGGWSTMAVGVPQQPDTYYFGAAGGGVWKTLDSGRTWRPITDALPITAVGALAVAPSDPNVVYVGTGHPEPRYDVGAGSGVYRSGDAGQTWHAVGLGHTRHIGAVLVDRRNADVVLVAAVGHLFGPSPERGVFRSGDGGRSWTRTLFVDEQTGAVDLAADPANPEIVYAATWTARAWPWLSYFTPVAGPGSAIYRSGDGGRTWARLGGDGWPAGNLGRIGIAVTRAAGATRIYATVTDKEHGGLYRSDDDGAHWRKVNDAAWATSWYVSRLTVSPTDPDDLYTPGQSIHESRDGGKTFTIVRGAPGGDDFHYLWINPLEPRRRIAASDQGAIVSVNGGESWSEWYNQPTGQFYYLATDNRFPYWIYSGQQDSGTAGIASRSDYAGLGEREWHPVGADERDYDIPDPVDPNIVYGSGLGGRITRWNSSTGEVQNVTPWPVSGYGKRPTDFRYHYTWFTPIAISKPAPHALYSGAQVLFRSLDRGTHWEVISPDLSGGTAGPQDCSGDPTPARALACGFGVINTIAPSPRDAEEIWTGTDSGLVWLTHDGGSHWRNVTPPGVPAWAKVSSIDLSATVAGQAYIAIDNHRQDDVRPRVYRTRDGGESWSELGAALPQERFVSVVRADPVRPGLLYAGTEVGVQVSFDDGAHWQGLAGDLPPVWVHDLLIKDDDLIAATVGRGIWVLDDVGPLRQAAPAAGDVARLYAPSPAYRLRTNQNRDTPPPPETPLGRNPPTGAVIHYWLAAHAKRPVELEIRDAAGRVVRRFSSADPADDVDVNRYFTADWLVPAPRISAEPGAHRFVWDLRYPRPKAVEYQYGIGASRSEGTPVVPSGPLVLPGDYRLTLLVDGKPYDAPLTIRPDPRVTVPAIELASAVEFHGELAAALERAWRGYAEVGAVRKVLESRRKALAADPTRAAVVAALAAFDAELQPLASGQGERSLSLAAASDALAGIATDVEGADRAPTAAQREAAGAMRERIAAATTRWQRLREHELAALNRTLAAARLAPIAVPDATRLKAAAPPAGQDLP
jgi:photosystem II stability/assembly factor-like uncharacterized protein